MKKDKIIYWTATIIITLFEGIIPLITPQAESAKAGAIHLGYPEYFGKVLIVFKIMGVLAVIVPQIPKRVKEWAYAGFAFDLIFAVISHVIVDGLRFQTFFPLIILLVLIASYISNHRISSTTEIKSQWHS